MNIGYFLDQNMDSILTRLGHYSGWDIIQDWDIIQIITVNEFFQTISESMCTEF